MAMGSAVYTTDANGSYSNLSGTSFAAPMVSAGAALVKSIFPFH